MPTENPRVWFKSISLENVRSFGTKQTINFTDDGTETGKAARWNVILGDNGTGKTTVLKGLCLPVKEIGYQEIDLVSMTRSLRQLAKISIDIEMNGQTVSSFFEVESSDTRAGEYLKTFRSTPANLYLNGLSLRAYGASRRIGKQTQLTEDAVKSSLFSDESDLLNAEMWLIKSQSDEKYYKNGRYSVVLNILKNLFREEVLDIFTSVPFKETRVFFKTQYGDVRLQELSLGYRTLTAWMVDFAKGLLDRYPDSENPLAEPAVCLVDEIDLHLHPKFQRTIIQFLTETFPNTQFIVTAHSPLIVLAAEERPLDANIILLKRESDHTVVVNDPVDVSKWSVDQILNSDLFGYVPPASEPLTELRTERDTLLAKPKLAKKEKDRLAELDEKIGFIPFGTNQNEIKAETIIQQLANALRNKQEAQ